MLDQEIVYIYYQDNNEGCYVKWFSPFDTNESIESIFNLHNWLIKNGYEEINKEGAIECGIIL